MLILGRKPGDSILIGDGIRIVVLACERGGVRLGIEAPSDVTILRGEIVSDIAAENQRAGATGTTGAASWVQAIGGPRPDAPSASAAAAARRRPSE
jgi:carbon storage regulator